MKTPALIVNGANSATVLLNGVAVLFSYETAVGFTDKAGARLRDPTTYSNTTAKHLSGAGYKDAPKAASRDAFEQALAEALEAAG